MMTKRRFRHALLGSCSLALIALTGCDTGVTISDTQNSGADSYTRGSADFSTFVALGDSLTAGFADSALYRMGQESSYPAIVARQLAMVGGGAFPQPLVNDNAGGLLLGGNPIPTVSNRLVLAGSPLAPTAVSDVPTTEVGMPLTGPIYNLGVPGAKSYHLGFPSYGDAAGLLTMPPTANPYFAYMRSANPATTVLADAVAQSPAFFVLWIGNNDTLSFATAGGATGVDQLGNPNPATYGSADLTDPTAFAGTYNSIVTALTAGGAKGVLVNLPDVTSIPYFTTVPYNAIPMDDAAATASNAAYAAYNAGLTVSGIPAAEVTRRTISFAPGQNALVIADDSLTDLSMGGLPSIRQATASDFILLPSSSKIGTESTPGNPATVWGVGTPMTNADVLTETEAALVAAANTAFNTTIEGIAAGNADLALFDARALLADVAAGGVNFGTGAVTSTFATGGAFSLDGVHPTARGYALVANRLMEAIESAFDAVLPAVNPGDYTTTFIQ